MYIYIFVNRCCFNYFDWDIQYIFIYFYFIEFFKGYFGFVYCVCFLLDGEFYVSGSEDGIFRLWQIIVGKIYGLWKCVMFDECVNNIDFILAKLEIQWVVRC